MQSFGQAKPPVGVVFDADFGQRIESTLAAALLYGLDGKNECRVVGMSVSKSNVRAAAFAEVLGRFYGGTIQTPSGTFTRVLPIGMTLSGNLAEDTPLLAAVLDRKNAEGKPMYPHGIHKLNDTADAGASIRNALTAQHDGNAVVILAGPATNLAAMLDVPGAKEWIEKKVRVLAMVAGEEQIAADPDAWKRVMAEWPSPILTGNGIAGSYPGARIETDFAWSTAHPVVDAYRGAGKMPYDAGITDMVTVLAALRPQEGFLQLEPEARRRRIAVDPSQSERLIQTCVELVSAKPVPRTFRRPQPAVVKPPAA